MPEIWTTNFDIWSVMQHFGDSVESQLQSERAASCKAGRVNTLSLVPQKFTKEDLIAASRKLGYAINKQLLSNRISMWKKRGLIKEVEGGYEKTTPDAQK